MTQPAYIPEKLVAYRLGRKEVWLRGKRQTLEREGFPRKDPLIGLTNSDDVDAWIARRRQVADYVEGPKGPHHDTTTTSKENLDAF